MSEFREALRRAVDSPAVESTPKPRAGEHVPVAPFRWDRYDSVCRDAENWIIGWQAMMDIANALQAERDLLREREREMVEALKLTLKLLEAVGITEGMAQQSARAALAKVRS